tara:strand:+ start:2520 stop:2672 length:153 start_codon:yes stop_codon:yes gene_type:complete
MNNIGLIISSLISAAYRYKGNANDENNPLSIDKLVAIVIVNDNMVFYTCQ